MTKKLKRIPSKTLAEGETTGHAHRVQVAVMEREDGVRIFTGPTPVTHEEHGKLDLGALDFASDRVNERDILSGMKRKVQD